MFARAAFSESEQGQGNNTRYTGSILQKSTMSYLDFLNDRCQWDEQLPIYGRAKIVQNSSPSNYGDFLDGVSELSYGDSWSNIAEFAGHLNLDYARYIVVSSNLKEQDGYKNDVNLHGLLEGIDNFKTKFESDPTTLNDLMPSDLRGKPARVIFMAARVASLEGKNIGVPNSILFEKKELHEIEDLAQLSKIINAGLNQIGTKNYECYSDEGLAYDYDFYLEEPNMLKESTSALYMAGTMVGTTREYAPRWITPYKELDDILRVNDNITKIDGQPVPAMGLIKRAFSEIFEHTSEDLRALKDEALAFSIQNPHPDFDETVGTPKVCVRYRAILDEMLKPDPKTGQIPLIAVFKEFGYSESEAKGYISKFRNSFNAGNDDANNIINLCLNQALGNSIRALAFDYFSRVIRAAQGESGTGVTWKDAQGATIMADVLNKAKNPYALFSYPMGLASHEFLALNGKIDAYTRSSEIIDGFCMRTDMLKLIYSVDTKGTTDPTTGYYVPENHSIVNDGMSGHPTIVPDALVDFVEKGKLTSKARTTIIYNLKAGEKPSPEPNHVSINDFVRWNIDNGHEDLLYTPKGGQPALLGSDDSMLVKKIGQMDGGVFKEFSAGYSTIDDAYANGEQNVVAFYELRDGSDAGHADFTSAIKKRKNGDTEDDSHWAVPFLKQQRGVQLHNNAFVQLEHKLDQSKVDVDYGSKQIEVGYLSNRYVSPLVDENGAFIRDPKTGKIEFGHQKQVTTNSKVGHVGSLMDGMTGAELEGFSNLWGESGSYKLPIPPQYDAKGDIDTRYRNGWDESLILNSMDKVIRNKTIYPSGIPAGVLGEVADFSWKNKYTDLYYFVSKAGEKESSTSNLYLGVTGSGGMFIPEYSSNLVPYDPFVKVEVDREEDQAVSIAKVPPQDSYIPQTPVINSLITTGQSQLPATRPSPNLNKDKNLYMGADGSYGDYVCYLDAGNTDLSVLGSIKMLGKNGTLDNTLTPIVGATTYTCAFGYNEDMGKFMLLPISQKGFDGRELRGKDPKELYHKKITLDNGTTGYKLYLDEDMKYEAGEARHIQDPKSGDMIYKFYASEKLADVFSDIASGSSTTAIFLKPTLEDYIIISETDEYGCSSRDQSSSQPGQPAYHPIEYNPYELDNRDHGFYGISQTVYRGYIDRAGSFSHAQDMLKAYGIEFAPGTLDDMIKHYDKAKTGEREPVDITIPSTSGRRIRFHSEKREIIVSGKLFESNNKTYIKLSNGKNYPLSGKDYEVLGEANGKDRISLSTTVLALYDADTGYQKFLEKIKNGASTFYMAEGGVFSESTMVQLKQQYDEANTQYDLYYQDPESGDKVRLFIFDPDALKYKDRYRLVDPGTGSFWDLDQNSPMLMEKTDIKRAKDKMKKETGHDLDLENNEDDLGSLNYVRPFEE